MFTNFEAQKVINSNVALQDYLETLSSIQPGSGSTEIHTYALKMLLEEILWHRYAVKAMNLK